jgi:hypothetical protein
MQTPATTSPRLDGIDAGRFADMLASPSFQLFGARIAAELERSRTDCEMLDGVALNRAQGKVTAYRTVLDLPARMLAEMKEPKPIPVPRPSGRGNATADGEGLVSGGR